MLIKPLTALVLAAAAGLFFTLSAEANPRFKIENATDKKIKVHIYNGDDTVCHTTASQGKVMPGNTKSFGCKGNGKGKCKVKLFSGSKRHCRNDRNTCVGKAIKMPGGSRAKVEIIDDISVCEITEKDD